MGERTLHAPGTFPWADLCTTDAAGAKAFYRELLGIRNGDSENGSVHLQGHDERGEVIVDPVEVPAGARVSVATDPQGAAFGLFDGPLDP